MIAPLRSILFVPGDSDRKIQKGLGTAADALILDLEDSVTPDNKPAARERVAELLSATDTGFSGQLWVRVNPPATPFYLDDVAAVVRHRPAGILLPKSTGPEDVQRLSDQLDILEAREGVEIGTIRILPVVTETAQAPFAIGRYAPANLQRLMGLTWGAEDLSAALGASENTDEIGQWAFTYRMVRSLCLLGAKACNVQAIETLYVAFRDAEGCLKSSRASRREGFTGRFAIHPDQVDPINEGYTPDAEDVAFSRRIVAAFDAAPGAGTVGLDGMMLDIPHLNRARFVLAIHKTLTSRNSG